MKNRISNIYWITACIISLSGCGGGSEESNRTASSSRTDGKTAQTYYFGDGNSESPGDFATSTMRMALSLPGWSYCRIGVFATNAANLDGCIGTTDSTVAYTPDVSYSDTTTRPIRCQPVTIGAGLVILAPKSGMASTDVKVGRFACYYFDIASVGNFSYEAKLPSGVTGVVELYERSSGGTGIKLTNAEGTGTISSSAAVIPGRHVLMLRTDSASGGFPIGLGIGTSAPSPSNITLSSVAIANKMGQTAQGVVETPGSTSHYYFFPQRTGQTSHEIKATFSANQQVTYQVVQQTGPSSFTAYNTATNTPIGQSGLSFSYTSNNPANAEGTATPYGILIKVSGINSSAPASEPFDLRVSTWNHTISGGAINNTENISRYFPISGVLQAANYVTYAGAVKDSNGLGVPNERVTVRVTQNTGAPTQYTENTYYTDQNGGLNLTLNFTPCVGTVISAYNYGPIGSADHWNGTAQNATITVKLPDAAPINNAAPTYTFPVTRICSETYIRL